MKLSPRRAGTAHSARRVRRRLALLLCVSGLLHIAVLLLWRSAPPAGPASTGSISVTLATRHGASAQPRAVDDRERVPALSPHPPQAEPDALPAPTKADGTAHRAARGVVKPVAERPAQASDPRANAVTAVPTPNPSDTSAPQSPVVPRAAGAGAPSGGLRDARVRVSAAARQNRVTAELQRALLPHFRYPPVARRRGWQGRVSIALLVRADGRLSDVELLESSGHALLDRAALDDVNRLHKVPAAVRWLDGRDTGVVLPVVYRLREARQ